MKTILIITLELLKILHYTSIIQAKKIIKISQSSNERKAGEKILIFTNSRLKKSLQNLIPAKKASLMKKPKKEWINTEKTN